MVDQTTPKVGQLLDGSEGRDAIHFALAPVTCSHSLWPSQRCVLVDSYTVRAAIGQEQPVGIVDPFLEFPTQPDDKFWLFLYPNTITGLRHVWTHPAFSPAKAPMNGDLTYG